MEQFFIERTTVPGDLVLGLCVGSGTTGVAAKGAGCEFLGVVVILLHSATLESPDSSHSLFGFDAGVEIDEVFAKGAELRIKAAKNRKLAAVRPPPPALAAAPTGRLQVSPPRSNLKSKAPAAEATPSP